MIKSLKSWYPKIRPLDLVICGAGRVIPSAMAIRGVTAGGKNVFNREISIHTGLVVEWRGQLLIAQMLTNGGLSIDSMETLIGKRKRFILGFRRSKVFDDQSKMDAAHDELALMYRKTLDYDFPGLFEFVDSKVKDRPGSYYCSELAYYILSKQGQKFPLSFAVMVSPYQLQRCPGLIDL